MPFQTGGDAVELVMQARRWSGPTRRTRFEAGTPSIVHVVTLAKALRLSSSRETGALPTRRRTSASEQPARQGGPAAARRPSRPTGMDLLRELRQTLIGTRFARADRRRAGGATSTWTTGPARPPLQPIWDVARRTWRQPEDVQAEIVRQVREIVAAFLGAPLDEYDVVFAATPPRRSTSRR